MIETCPSPSDLEAYALGKLADDEIESVFQHVETCSDCEATVAMFDDDSDTFADRFHGPLPADEFKNEPELRAAVAAASDLSKKSRASREDTRRATLRDYRLMAKLGEGGMGTVYKALHTKLNRIVALKMLPADRVSHRPSVARFAREIEAVGKLDHPNIVRAFDAGEDEEMHYLVMEMIDGVDLHRLVKQTGPLSVADACEIVRQTALGLQHAHEHGLVHRDVKPSNLLLARDGTVKVLDLGLALLQGEPRRRDELTSTGQVMGTLDYIAPEQASDSHQVDIRADVYSLGCTLFKLLTGRAPFAAEQHNSALKKLMAHAQTPAPSLADRRGDVPDDLVELLDRMLAKDPHERPATPAEVAVALEPLASAAELPALMAHVESTSSDELPAASADEIPVMLQRRGDFKRQRWIGVAGFLVLLIAGVALCQVIMVTADDPFVIDDEEARRLMEKKRVWRGTAESGVVELQISGLPTAEAAGHSVPDAPTVRSAPAEKDAAKSHRERLDAAKQLAKRDVPSALRQLYQLDQDIVLDHDLGKDTDGRLLLEIEGLMDRLDTNGDILRPFREADRAESLVEALASILASLRQLDGSDVERDFRRAMSAVTRIRLYRGEIDSMQALPDEVQRQVLQKMESARDIITGEATWTFQNPIVLDTFDQPAEDHKPFMSGPVDLVPAFGGYLLVSQRQLGSGTADIWRSDGYGGADGFPWRRVHSVENAGWPYMFYSSKPEAAYGVSVLGSLIIDGNAISGELVRFSGNDLSEVNTTRWRQSLHSPIRVERVGGAVVHADGFYENKGHGFTDGLFVRLTDKDDPARGQSVYLKRNASNGDEEHWQEPRLIDGSVRWPTTALRPPVFRFHYEHPICMILDEDARPVVFRSRDHGKTWNKELMALHDDVADRRAWRIPVTAVEDYVGMIYAVTNGNEREKTYRLCYCDAGDEGRSWTKGIPFTPSLPWRGEAMLNARAFEAGGVIAVSCVAPGEQLDDFEVRLAVSLTGGTTWDTIPMSDRFDGRIERNALKITGSGRIVCVADVYSAERASGRHQLIVQEIRPGAFNFSDAPIP